MKIEPEVNNIQTKLLVTKKGSETTLSIVDNIMPKTDCLYSIGE